MTIFGIKLLCEAVKWWSVGPLLQAFLYKQAGWVITWICKGIFVLPAAKVTLRGMKYWDKIGNWDRQVPSRGAAPQVIELTLLMA